MGGRGVGEVERGGVAQTMYTHVSKCKNVKIKKFHGKTNKKFKPWLRMVSIMLKPL
jgi:hypothetical protein